MESSTETEELGTVTVPLTTAREEEEPTRNSQLQQGFYSLNAIYLYICNWPDYKTGIL